jgi:hypothetical protein
MIVSVAKTLSLTKRRGRIDRLVLSFLLAGYLLFNHGCHAHEPDLEPWAKICNWIRSMNLPS